MNQEEAELINDLDMAMDAEHWVTMNGSPVLIEGTDGGGYEVKGGAGGKMNGVKVSPKSMSGARLNEKTSSFSDPSFKPHEPKSEPPIPSGHEKLTKPLKIARETEKAYAVKNQAYEDAREDGLYDVKELSMSQIELLRSGSSLTWLPKSHSHAHEGHVVSMSGWLAAKNGHETHESKAKQDERDKKSDERFSAGVKRYEELLAKAKEAGVKGVRSGMRSSTIQEKLDSHLAGKGAVSYIQAGKKNGLPQYANVNEKTAHAFASAIHENHHMVDSGSWIFDARGNGLNNEDFVSGGLLEKGDDKYKHRFTPAGKELAHKVLSEKAKNKISSDSGIALDKSLRTYDTDGRMHVSMVNISKATVNPYRGSEIPGWQDLGLDADKVYQMLRDPKELEAAAPTFKNLPLLIIHEPVNAEDSKRELTVGTTGSDTEFAHPYLRCSLAIWDKEGIAAVESGEQKELSSAYHYDPDMTAGEFEGVKYDGVMRNIRGNHVALVDVGRAGRDVVVSDQDPFTNRNEEMTKKNPLAKDGEIDVDDAVKLLAALNGESPTPAVTDEFPDENEPAADNSGVLDFLKGKLSDEDMATITSMLSGGAADEAPDDETAEDEAPAVPVPPKDTDKSPAMDAAMVGAVVNAALKKQSELYEARKAVESIVGECTMDSAAAVYKFALGEMGIDTKGIHPSAYPALVSMAKDRAPTAKLGMDRAAVDKVAAQFPEINRFK